MHSTGTALCQWSASAVAWEGVITGRDCEATMLVSEGIAKEHGIWDFTDLNLSESSTDG